jgi:CDP-diacylglycerol--serine O-phosphatidyltransferase
MNQARGRPQTFADREPMRGAAAKDRRRFRRGVYLLPSVFTLGNMFCGYACVVYSMRGEYETAAPLLAIALVLDALDGRIARLTGTESAFGVQFDSLADVISFGMAPAVLAFNWGLSSLGRLGWAAGFLFVTAGAMRLARFNIQAQADKRYFVGMPIPAAAAVPAVTVYFFPDGLAQYYFALPALAVVIVPALLMVSTIRYRSFKNIDLQSRRSYKVLLAIAAVLVAIATHPKLTLLLLAYGYLLSGAVELAVSRVRRRGAAPSPQSAEAAVAGAADPDG